MDAVTGAGEEPSPGRRVRIAAFNSGIGPGEPLEPIIEELAKFADTLPSYRQQIKTAIEEAKQPFPKADIDRLAKETANAAYRYSEERHNQMLGQTYRKNIVKLSSIFAAAIVVTLGLGLLGGYFYAWRDAEYEIALVRGQTRDVPIIDGHMRADNAARWANLLKLNYPMDMDKGCTPGREDGRATCRYTFWTEPPRSAAR